MKIAHVCFVGLLMAQPVWAQTDAPISAIDWLSQPGLTPLSEEPLVVGDPARGAELAEIDVIELDAPVEKTYGLIPSKISGIPEKISGLTLILECCTKSSILRLCQGSRRLMICCCARF